VNAGRELTIGGKRKQSLIRIKREGARVRSGDDGSQFERVASENNSVRAGGGLEGDRKKKEKGKTGPKYERFLFRQLFSSKKGKGKGKAKKGGTRAGRKKKSGKKQK